MAEMNYIGVALLMGIFLIVIATSLSRLRGRHRYNRLVGNVSEYTNTGTEYDDPIQRVVHRIGGVSRSPRVWLLTFTLLVVAMIGAVLLFVGDFGLPEGTATAVGGVLGGLLAVMVVAYLTAGVYLTARRRGHPFAHSVGESLMALGFIFVLVVVARLLVF